MTFILGATKTGKKWGRLHMRSFFSFNILGGVKILKLVKCAGFVKKCKYNLNLTFFFFYLKLLQLCSVCGLVGQQHFNYTQASFELIGG